MLRQITRTRAHLQREKIHDMTATMRKCSRDGCGERFSLAFRGGRNSDKAMAGRKRTYHDARRYCSDTCRKLASKARRAPINRPVIRPATHLKAPEATTPLSTVTTTTNLVDISAVFGAQKSTRPPLQMTFGDYTVVPDPEWPAMYRVRSPDGSLTDMVNLTRARDAARCFAEQERRQEPLAIAA
jgi:hypothetical protein